MCGCGIRWVGGWVGGGLGEWVGGWIHKVSSQEFGTLMESKKTAVREWNARTTGMVVVGKASGSSSSGAASSSTAATKEKDRKYMPSAENVDIYKKHMPPGGKIVHVPDTASSRLRCFLNIRGTTRSQGCSLDGKTVAQVAHILTKWCWETYCEIEKKDCPYRWDVAKK